MAKDPYIVSAFKRGLEVIDCFSEKPQWTIAELAVRLGQNKPTLLRMLHTLVDGGHLVKDDETKTYSLGMRFYSLGNSAVRNEQLRWQALPPLQDLAEVTGETVYVGLLYEGSAVCVQIVEGSHTVRMHAFVGKRSPAHVSALGKVQLAYLPDADVDAFIKEYPLERYTPNSITDPAEFKEELRRISKEGYALDNEEMELGLRCVAAPITGYTGRPFATVSVSAPLSRMSDTRIEGLIPHVKATAAQISHMLGSPMVSQKPIAMTG